MKLAESRIWSEGQLIVIGAVLNLCDLIAWSKALLVVSTWTKLRTLIRTQKKFAFPNISDTFTSKTSAQQIDENGWRTWKYAVFDGRKLHFILASRIH